MGPTAAPPPSVSAPTSLPPPGASGPIKVALLVPLSGQNADLGKSMLEAAQLALFETGGDRLTLVPRDSGGTAESAAGAARAVLSEGVKLIIGPLLAAEVEGVKPVARDARINVIAFSTLTQLGGDNVFLMGFLPRDEVRREVSYARERGLSRFAALVPKTPYGQVMADALRDAVTSGGGTVSRIELFDPRSPDTAIKRLLAGGKPTAAAGAPPPGAEFEALLLPEGGDQLKQIAKQLRQTLDENQVRLLGSGLWDDPSISNEPALYGSWYAASPPAARRDFDARFQKTYSHVPPRLASLAFDSAALAAALAKAGDDDPFPRQAILNPAGFTGVDGLFRFTPDGLVQRGLAVIEVGPAGVTVVSPAPRSFPDLAY
jgi:ABC-type branched-subunit amino acid transport system substrate-binding protein